MPGFRIRQREQSRCIPARTLRCRTGIRRLAQLSPGEDRAQALSQALPQWVARDPLVASEWINQLDANPDLATDVASVATLANLVNHRPEIAVGWAESISEPVLRANTLWMIAQQWAHTDPDGIRRFLAAVPDLAVNDRRALLDALNPPPEAY